MFDAYCKAGWYDYMTEIVQHPQNQLDRVICQIRFPAILEIDKKIDEYQKELRNEYPLYVASPSLQFNLANAPLPINHTFQTDDGTWSIGISVAALSVTTTRYSDWNEFKHRFESALRATTALFDIKRCTRLGLRYINAIRPSSIGLSSAKDAFRHPYSDMMNAGIGIGAPSLNAILDYDLPGGPKGRSIIGTIQFMDGGENGALIDDDIYIEGSINIESIPDTIDHLNDYSLMTFRKIASDELIEKVMP